MRVEEQPLTRGDPFAPEESLMAGEDRVRTMPSGSPVDGGITQVVVHRTKKLSCRRDDKDDFVIPTTGEFF